MQLKWANISSQLLTYKSAFLGGLYSLRPLHCLLQSDCRRYSEPQCALSPICQWHQRHLVMCADNTTDGLTEWLFACTLMSGNSTCRMFSSSTQRSQWHHKLATGIHHFSCQGPVVCNRPNESTGSHAELLSDIRQTCVSCGSSVQLPCTCHLPHPSSHFNRSRTETGL